ncbi:MAG: hypothetical protein R2867_26935 [Caldilineaceae bacterium]
MVENMGEEKVDKAGGDKLLLNFRLNSHHVRGAGASEKIGIVDKANGRVSVAENIEVAFFGSLRKPIHSFGCRFLWLFSDLEMPAWQLAPRLVCGIGPIIVSLLQPLLPILR